MEQGPVNNITVEIGVRKLYTVATQGLSLMVYEPAHKPGCINGTTSVLEMTRITSLQQPEIKSTSKSPTNIQPCKAITCVMVAMGNRYILQNCKFNVRLM